jgi:hypothetical protein
MELHIAIDDRKLMLIASVIIAVSLVGLTMAYGGTSPATMGHSWGEMECTGCIATGHLADNSVTTGKVTDGAITDAKLASGISGSKITGTVPAATAASTLGGNTSAQLKDGLGMTLPASTICTFPSYGQKTLNPFGGVVIKDGMISIPYTTGAMCQYECDSGTIYNKYYFGKKADGSDWWSACSEVSNAGGCYCPPIGGP